MLDGIGAANAQKEYYLTDIVAPRRRRSGWGRGWSVAAGEEEVLGVNDRVQLARAEAVAQERLRRAAMLGGATLIAPQTVFLSYGHDRSAAM